MVSDLTLPKVTLKWLAQVNGRPVREALAQSPQRELLIFAIQDGIQAPVWIGSDDQLANDVLANIHSSAKGLISETDFQGEVHLSISVADATHAVCALFPDLLTPYQHWLRHG